MIHSASLLLVAHRQWGWVAEMLPPPAPHQLLVRTRTTAVSVGTELPLYRGDQRAGEPLAYPLMTGYESVGEVVACGSAVAGFAVGDRVLAFYGHRTYALVSAVKAIPIPPTIPDALALLAILGCDTAKGIGKIAPQPEERVLITGAGVIGLLALFNLVAQGVRAVDVVEPVAGRRQWAYGLGAQTAVPPAEAHQLTAVYPVGVECSSRNEAFGLLQEKLGQGGRLCVLADGNVEPLVLSPAFHAKELLVVGSSDGLDYAGYAGWFFEQVARSRPLGDLLSQWYEVETAASHLPSLLGRMVQGELKPAKVLVHYAGTNSF